MRVAVGGLLAVVLVATLDVAFSSLYRYGVDGPITNATDFRVFYCGGKVLRTGGDPYRFEPLHACEIATLETSGLRGSDHVLPAPFPPYALSIFALFSFLPIREATQLWLALSVAAVGGGVAFVSALSRVRPALVAAALVFALAFVSLMLGQIVPIVFCAIAFAAYRARAGDGRGAAAGAAIATLEPHLALPLWIGLAAFVPPARRWLAIAGVAVSALSLCSGWALNLEFATSVLPLHARSEIENFSAQYSLSALSYALGTSLRFASLAGAVSYAVMLVTGTLLGGALARRFNDRALAALTPVAAVLLGGEFLHITQIVLALPFAFVLFRYVPKRTGPRALAIAAVIALAIPWESIVESPLVWPHLAVHHAPSAAPVLPVGRANDSSEISYTAYIDAFAERLDPRSFAEQLAWKLPTWFALLSLLGVATTLGVRREAGRVPNDA